MKGIFFTTLIILISVCQGCIHTYPDAGAEDPTEVELTVDLSLSLQWGQILAYYPPVRGGAESYRLIIEIQERDITRMRHEQMLSSADFEKGSVTVRLPAKLRPVVYSLAVWLDAVSSDASASPAFDVSTLSSVTPVFRHGEYPFPEDCGFAETSLDLTEYVNKLQGRRIIQIEMSSPGARFRFETTDVESFLRYADSAIQKGEKYTLTLSYNDPVALAFNVFSGEPTGYDGSVEVSVPLPALFSSQVAVFSDWVFTSKEREEISVMLTLYNSAKMIVSRIKRITFPVERGKTTVVRGDFLTNFYSGNVSVDNLWDDEIIIRIE